MNNIIKQPMLPDTIHFHHTMNNDNTEVMRITRDGVWVNPDLSIDDTAKAVLAALDSQIKVLVQAEREASIAGHTIQQLVAALEGSGTRMRSDQWYIEIEAVAAGKHYLNSVNKEKNHE